MTIQCMILSMVNANGSDAKMTFEEFANVYRTTFARLMSYKPTEVGSGIYAEKLADLADAYPEWAEQVEEEG